MNEGLETYVWGESATSKYMKTRLIPEKCLDEALVIWQDLGCKGRVQFWSDCGKFFWWCDSGEELVYNV